MTLRRTAEGTVAAGTPAIALPAAEREPEGTGSSAAWVAALSAAGPVRDRAVAELHALLVRAARFEAHRRGGVRPHVREALEDIAQQSAGDALVAILAKLDTFRGESRFTTWAYKFAILETAVALRRHEWQGREIPLEHDRWQWLRDERSSPARRAQTHELLGAVREAIDGALTDHQRRVLVAVTLDDVPIDVLAERLNTTRGALYKTLHDARRRLRDSLAERGFDLAALDEEAGA